MAKKMTKKLLKRKLWKEISFAIKKRDAYKCWLCGKAVDGSDAHCSHILPKGAYPRYEFEEWNLKTLCYHCHIGKWHKDPIMVAREFKRLHPKSYTNAVIKARNYPTKSLTTTYLMDLYKKYLKQNE